MHTIKWWKHISMKLMEFYPSFLLFVLSFIAARVNVELEWIKKISCCSRKDLSLKDCKIDILLITGMLSPYATVVEKLHRDVDKERVTMMKVERAGDVLVDTVSVYFQLSLPLLTFFFCTSLTFTSIILCPFSTSSEK